MQEKSTFICTILMRIVNSAWLGERGRAKQTVCLSTISGNGGQSDQHWFVSQISVPVAVSVSPVEPVQWPDSPADFAALSPLTTVEGGGGGGVDEKTKWLSD